MEDTSALTESKFLKVARAIDGDDHFNDRIGMALEIMGHAVTRANRIHIANAVVDNIVCTVQGTVETDLVTDDQIVSAMATLPEPTQSA